MARILAVDDEPLQLSLIRKTLERGGHTVLDMTEPQKVVERLKHTRIDALITDVMMPGMTGWELIEALREQPHARYLPILVLSALKDVPDRVRAIRMGACDFLDKPFNSSELLARIEGLISRTQEGFSVFQGHLEAYSAAEAAQHFELNKKTGVLELQSGIWQGVIEFAEGRTVAARTGHLVGVEAIQTMLAFKVGTFHVRQGQVNHETDTMPSINALVLEAVWLEDELNRLQPFLPEDSRVLSVVDPQMKLWIPDKYVNLPIEPIWKYLCDQPGQTIQNMVEKLAYAPNRIRLATAHLLEHKLLKSTAAILEQRWPLWRTGSLDAVVDAFCLASARAGLSNEDVRLAFVFGKVHEKDKWMKLLFPGQDRRLHSFEVGHEAGFLLIDINLSEGSGYGHTLNSIRHSDWVLVFCEQEEAWDQDHLTDIESVVPAKARKILIAPNRDSQQKCNGWSCVNGDLDSFETLLETLAETVPAAE